MNRRRKEPQNQQPKNFDQPPRNNDSVNVNNYQFSFFFSAGFLLVIVYIIYIASPKPATVVNEPLPTIVEDKPKFRILEEKIENGTRYAVVDDFEKERRLLICNDTFLGGVWTSDYSSLFLCFAMQSSVSYAVKAPERALQIGLGVGIAARELLSDYPNLDLEVIEISQNVLFLAYRYFKFYTKGQIYIDDALHHFYSNETIPKIYDIIIHDVFSAGSHTVELFTREFLTLLKNNYLHKEQGILVLNYVGNLKSVATKSVCLTVKSVFPFVRIFSDSKNREGIMNLIFYASNSPIEFDIPEMLLEDPNYQGNHAPAVKLHIQDWEIPDPTLPTPADPTQEEGNQPGFIITSQETGTLAALAALQQGISDELWREIKDFIPPELWGAHYHH